MDTGWIFDIKNYCAKVTSFFNNEIYIDRVTEFYMYFAICIINIFGNVLNVVIHSQRKIAISSVNLIFIALAVTDFALSAVYLFDIFINYFLPHIVKNGSYHQVLYGYWTTFISRVIHFILLWLTILLAYWRYEAWLALCKIGTDMTLRWSRNRSSPSTCLAWVCLRRIFFAFK